ncbi:MAG: hypothetical protein ABSE95_12645 [Thermodesulfobacteriota bacterium]
MEAGLNALHLIKLAIGPGKFALSYPLDNPFKRHLLLLNSALNFLRIHQYFLSALSVEQKSENSKAEYFTPMSIGR